MPLYSPGLPMLMALAKLVAGQCAMFWIVPLAGALLVFATYGIGRRLGRPMVGIAAAWIVATSPAMLFMLMAPMSDVPAAAAWAVAVACLLSDAPFAAGAATAIAILIRPNLVPLAAVLAIFSWRSSRALRLAAHPELVEGWATRSGQACRGMWPLRSSLSFAGTASCGAIAIALINARLYGSPLASGYGDLSDAYSWSYFVPNVRRYLSWLASAETPFAIAGLVCLFLPLRGLWTTPESRRARWLLAAFAAGVWAFYLIYVPWDAWWYLRFLLPAWPMMAIGTASLLAPLYHGRSLVRRVTAVCIIAALGVAGVVQAAQRDVFSEAAGEAKYVEVAKAVETIVPPDAVIISGQFSGSIRYYAGRLTLRWEFLDPRWLDRASEWLAARGHRVFIVLEEPEMEPFRSRFAAANAIGRVDWTPLVEFRGRSIKLYDTVNRDRFEPPIQQPTLRAVRECLPQQPVPRLKLLP